MNDYLHAMDRVRSDPNLNLPVDYIGISAPPFENQLTSLRTRIFQGLGHVELGFTGTGKGSMAGRQTTPEMYGSKEREAMRQLAKLNKVSLSTHATVGVGGLAGQTERGFAYEAQEKAVNEIKRSVDFAADTARGGPVVFHAGEFPRPISTYEREGFEGYPGEKEKGMIFIANQETGSIHAIRRDDPVSRPTTEKDKYGNEILKLDNGEIQFKTVRFQDVLQEEIKKKKDSGEVITPKKEAEIAIEIFKKDRQKDLEISKAEEGRYLLQAKQITQDRERLEESRDWIKEQLERTQSSNLSREAKERTKKTLAEEAMNRALGPRQVQRMERFPELVREMQQDPLKFLNEQIAGERDEERVWQNAALSYGRRWHEQQRELDNIKTIEEVGLQRTNDGIARTAIYAWKKEKAQGLEKPLFVAPENIWPETGYGAHPKELKNIIQQSRQRMVERLTQPYFQERVTENGKEVVKKVSNPDYDPAVNKNQATKIAEDHIKATFDIGHANIWRKYFNGTDEDFKKWMGKQIDELNKEKIIGHVHISDNFGFEDEHVTPGEGNAPIGPFTKKMREAGYEGKMIIEPAHQDFEAWTGGLKFFGSPIYRTQTWTDIEGSYLTQGSGSPTYMVGSYATDVGFPEESRDLRFWSRLPIE